MSTALNRVLIYHTMFRVPVLPDGRKPSRQASLQLAQALADVGVDVIEAGAPAVSNEQWQLVNAIACQVQGAVVCARACCSPKELELAAKALDGAHRARIQVSMPAAPSETTLYDAAHCVRIARNLCGDVEFSVSDPWRLEFSYIARMAEATISAGAETFNLADPNGDAIPAEVDELIRYLRSSVPALGTARLSIRFQNRLGMAVANSLNAVIAGADQVECAISGWGANDMDCSMEAFVTAINLRENFFNVATSVELDRLTSLCGTTPERYGLTNDRAELRPQNH